MINIDGTCSSCPAYMILQPDKRGCIDTGCYGMDIIDIDGSCKMCIPPFRPSLPDRKLCINEACPS